MTQFSNSLSETSATTWQICSPGNLQGRRTNPTTALLTWDEPYSTCHLCPDAVGYEVSGDGIDTVTVSRPPCEITGLKADVEYSLSVYAMAAGNNRSQPSEAHIGISPGKPGNLRVRRITGTSASLSWTAPPTTVPISAYVIYCDEEFVASVRGLDYLVTGLMNATSHTFQVRAMTTSGSLSEAATATPPNPPTNLEVVATTPSSVTFTWDGANGVTGYEISVNDTVVDTIVQTSFVVRNPAGAYFSFSVRARDAAGNVSQAEAQSTPNPDREPPARPPGLRLLSSTYTSVTLGWDVSTDNVGVTGYRFFSPDGTQTDIQTTSYTVTGLQPGVVYYCAVRAYDAAGNLSDVSSLDVSPGDRQAPTIPTNLRVIDDVTWLTVAWDPSEDNIGVKGYAVRVSTLSDDEVLSDTTDQTRYTMKDLLKNMGYIFSVRAFDVTGNLSEPARRLVTNPFFLRLISTQVGLNPNDRVGLTLNVQDEYGFPASGADVEWQIGGGLTLDETSGKTDASGYCLNSFTAPADGLDYANQIRLEAKCVGKSRAIWFRASGVSASPLNPSFSSSVRVTVWVFDAAGKPLEGAVVKWSGARGIGVQYTESITDSTGAAGNAAFNNNANIAPMGKVSAKVEGRTYYSQTIKWREKTHPIEISQWEAPVN
ncbi:fibronectin type III domain-containing protein [Pseudomonas fluorescens]|uniref:Fibronectin type-III domain-containing protein n=1 Tax=Pseudomonas fluorescens TaxID=294 RepID=A0A5E7CZ76_PSEFL|nr:fibronectin type III domain-containing protein [Pseudomonas fluorescens]VVO00824.1 hypothetical protein PS691_02618 [Pseudomonas fluorescens]